MRLMTRIGEFSSIKTTHRTTTHDSNFHDEDVTLQEPEVIGGKI